MLLQYSNYFLVLPVVSGMILPYEQGPLTILKESSTSLNNTDIPIVWQDERTCNADTRQFTGKVPLSAGKTLFFWFTESRESATERPTILWLNGGPGASSLPGLFGEIGPCQLTSVTNTTVNPYSWANFANLLFLDQPAGVGFSTPADDGSYPVTLAEASDDFTAFLTRFVNQYPQYFQHGFYIAGESFGGRYVPRFTADLVRRQLSGAPDALPVQVRGIVLANALVDGTYSLLSHYELFCTDGPTADLLRFNATVCDAIAAAMPEAERLQRVCQATYDPILCQAANEFGHNNLYKYFQEQVDALKHSPYDLRLGCDAPPICIPVDEYSVGNYLNNPEIQALLGIGKYQEYVSINFNLNFNWSTRPEIMLPTTREVSYLVDVAKVRFLVLNGNYDVILNTPGAFREWTDLPWHGNVQFRMNPKRDWYFEDSTGARHKGGQLKGRGLQVQVAGVDNAGHMSPGDQKEAVSFLVREWIQQS
ncbi:hypothetical protein TrVGV298_009528 [Trichoderma virens]|nr:hypothetical protein TrVGV298_009528 [Trichoderma virens]